MYCANHAFNSTGGKKQPGQPGATPQPHKNKIVSELGGRFDWENFVFVASLSYIVRFCLKGRQTYSKVIMCSVSELCVYSHVCAGMRLPTCMYVCIRDQSQVAFLTSHLFVFLKQGLPLGVKLTQQARLVSQAAQTCLPVPSFPVLGLQVSSRYLL